MPRLRVDAIREIVVACPDCTDGAYQSGDKCLTCEGEGIDLRPTLNLMAREILRLRAVVAAGSRDVGAIDKRATTRPEAPVGRGRPRG